MVKNLLLKRCRRQFLLLQQLTKMWRVNLLLRCCQRDLKLMVKLS